MCMCRAEPTQRVAWLPVQAFAEIMAAIADAGHPSLLPPIHAELLPSSSKLATVRPLLAAGSVKDVRTRPNSTPSARAAPSRWRPHPPCPSSRMAAGGARARSEAAVLR